mgnify:FL=1|tara:strand:- start:279 stop:575 length:297 start_codon:yes stop_codon:yes gene_type:complete
MGYTNEGIGYQNTDTSQQAANFNRRGKVSLRDQVRELFQTNEKLTVEDIARLLERAEISVQPRVSELKKEGFLVDSTERRKSRWGANTIVWTKDIKDV